MRGRGGLGCGFWGWEKRGLVECGEEGKVWGMVGKKGIV